MFLKLFLKLTIDAGLDDYIKWFHRDVSSDTDRCFYQHSRSDHFVDCKQAKVVNSKHMQNGSESVCMP